MGENASLMNREQVEALLVATGVVVGVLGFAFAVGWGFAEVIGWIHSS